MQKRPTTNLYLQTKKAKSTYLNQQDIMSTACQLSANAEQSTCAALRPTTRLITGTPCFTVKATNCKDALS